MPQVSHDDCVDWRAAVQNARIVTVRTVRGGHLGQRTTSVSWNMRFNPHI